jgi:hypothetical protein
VDIFGDDTINIKMETDDIEEFGKTAKQKLISMKFGKSNHQLVLISEDSLHTYHPSAE